MKKIIFILAAITRVFIANAQTTTLTIEQYKGKADGVVLADGVIDAGNVLLKSNTATFKNDDIGKIAYIAGAGKNNGTLIANIISVKSAHAVELDVPASTSISITGVTYGTDCTNSFVQFNKAARLLRKQKVVLNMQPGIYLTSFNNWIAGITNITVNGNKAGVICTHGAKTPGDFAWPNIGLYTPTCFDNVDNNFYVHSYINDLSFGSKIKSANKGSESVQTINTGDTDGFRTGDWVLVYGLHIEDFFGFPPNPQYFEYLKVTKVNDANRTISLSAPLKNYYDASWPDGSRSDGVGAPRILDLNRSNFNIVENITMNDITFLPFNGWNGKLANDIRNGRLSLYGFINATLNNVTASSAYFGNGSSLHANGIHLNFQCEADKVLDTLVIKNSTIKDFSHAGGINTLILNNNNFLGNFDTSPKALYLEGNTFDCQGSNTGSMASLAFNHNVEYMRIGTNTWISSSPVRTSLFSTTNAVKMNVGKVISTHTVTIPYQDFVKSKASRQVIPGASGSTADGKKVKVTGIFRYDADNIGVNGNFSSPPQQGDVFIFEYAHKIDIVGKQIRKGPYANQLKLFQAQPKKTTLINFSSESLKQ